MGSEPAETLLDQIARTPHENEAEWLHFVTSTLRMDGCYVPAAQRVVGQGAWRRHTGKGQNVIGYIKTATYREALKLGLALDRYDRTEPRVRTKDQPPINKQVAEHDELRFDFSPRKVKGHVPLPITPGVNFEDQIDSLHARSLYSMPAKTGSGAWRQGDGFGEDDPPRIIPTWLQRADEPDEVDWDIVARYAAQKSRMVPALAKTLRLRFGDHTGRPAAMAAAKNKKAAREVENAWKWIDRNWREKIAPLFQLQKPPSVIPKPPAKPKREGFMPPAEALNRALRRAAVPRDVINIGPSLQNQDRLGSMLAEIGFPQSVRVGWSSGNLIVSLGSGQIGLSVSADTPEEAVEIIRELVAAGEIDVRKPDFGLK